MPRSCPTCRRHDVVIGALCGGSIMTTFGLSASTSAWVWFSALLLGMVAGAWLFWCDGKLLVDGHADDEEHDDERYCA